MRRVFTETKGALREGGRASKCKDCLILILSYPMASLRKDEFSPMIQGQYLKTIKTATQRDLDVGGKERERERILVINLLHASASVLHRP